MVFVLFSNLNLFSWVSWNNLKDTYTPPFFPSVLKGFISDISTKDGLPPATEFSTNQKFGHTVSWYIKSIFCEDNCQKDEIAVSGRIVQYVTKPSLP